MESALAPVTLNGEPTLLQALVQNLLNNVADHCPAGTRVKLRTGLEAGRPVLEARDDGPGLPEALRGQLGAGFTRLDSRSQGLGIGLGLSILAAQALAEDRPGGFTGPDTLQVVSTAAIKTLSDDTPVKLQGYVVKSLGDERYEFKDDAGTIVVEIDGDDWRGIQATPETRLELRGEVDKEWSRTEVDVDSVALVP